MFAEVWVAFWQEPTANFVNQRAEPLDPDGLRLP